MPKLFEVPDDVDDVIAPEDEPTYGTGYEFDFATGDYVSTAGRVPQTDGHRAWVDWCIHTVLTQRYVHEAYSDDYGTDLATVGESGSFVERETTIENAITEALESDERTGSVHSFVFEWSGDQCFVEFVIEPTLGTAETIRLPLQGVP